MVHTVIVEISSRSFVIKVPFLVSQYLRNAITSLLK